MNSTGTSDNNDYCTNNNNDNNNSDDSDDGEHASDENKNNGDEGKVAEIGKRSQDEAKFTYAQCDNTASSCLKSALSSFSSSNTGNSYNCSISSVSCSSSSSTAISSLTPSSQIRRYAMNDGTESSTSPCALKLPRTLSTSVLKVKYRSSFWEKFWEERSKRDM